MTKTYLALAILVTAFLVAGNTYAGDISDREITTQEWMSKYKNPDSAQEMATLLAYFRGVSQGITWMDTKMLVARDEGFLKGKVFICKPQGTLTTDKLINMLNELLNYDPRWIHFPLGMTMVAAYKLAFPCEK
tara:strand:- start:3946 stop:4344 length:399 start_codon:yes stop_codon:yes gene_type:complete